jgi:two-component system CheB/CheR fusion protein
LNVLKTSNPVQKEIESANGRYYLMKIMPYLRQDNTTDGAVVTFVDISKVKGLNNLLEGVLDSSLNGIMAFSFVKDAENRIIDLEWTLVNEAAETILGKKGSGLAGKRLLKELPVFEQDGLYKKFLKVAETGKNLHLEY